MTDTEFFSNLFRSFNKCTDVYGGILSVTRALRDEQCDEKRLRQFIELIPLKAETERAAALFRGVYLSPHTEDIARRITGSYLRVGRSYATDRNIQFYRHITVIKAKLTSCADEVLTLCKEYAFYHGLYGDMFVCMMRNNNVREASVNFSLLAEFPDGAGISAEAFDACLNYMQTSRVEQKFLAAFIGKLTPEQKSILMNRCTDSFRFEPEELEVLSVKNRLTALYNMGSDKKVLPYLKAHLQELLQAGPAPVAGLLIRLCSISYSKTTQNSLEQLIRKMPHPAYLICRAKTDHNSGLFYRERFPDMNTADYDAEMVESLLLYTNLSYEFTSLETGYTVTCQVSDFQAAYQFAMWEEDGHCELSFTRLTLDDEPTHQVFMASVLEAIRRSDGENYARELEEAERKAEQARRRKALEMLQKSVNDLSRGLERCESPLNRGAQQFLECRFEMEDNEFFVAFKVGKVGGRSYVVKNAISFLRAFSQGSEEAYGKVTVVHQLQCFDDLSRQLLDYLLMFPVSMSDYDYYRARYVKLPPAAVEKLLTLQKGHTVYFHEKDYRLSAEPIECEAAVQDDCTVTCSLAGEEKQLIELNRSLLYLDDKTGQAAFVAGDLPHLKLVYFAFINNGVDITPVLDRFAAAVYPTVGNRLTVSDSVRRRMEQHVLTIKAYFDYTNQTVTLRTEYTLGDRSIRPDTLTDPVNTARYNRFTEIIQSFGFADDVLSGDGADDFLGADLTQLKTVAEVFISDTLAAGTVVRFIPESIRIRYENDLMTAFVDSGEYSDEDLAAVVKAIRKKKKYVHISGDRIIRTDDSAAIDFSETVEDLALDENRLTEAQRIPTAQSLRAFAHEKNCDIDAYLREIMYAVSHFREDTAPLPQLETVLPDYQQDGFRWMRVLSRYNLGGILADDMGLGKTVEVIALLQADDTAEPSLVVCPKSVVYNWKNEFRRFAPDIKVIEIYGSAAERAAQLEKIPDNEKIVYVTSYDSLRNDIDRYRARFCYLILDEAQYIKNVSAQKSKSVKQLNARHCFALTGTPIENSVLDLWSIFDFILPGYLENLTAFKSKYTKDERYHEKIAKSTAPFILRRTKENVLTSLPEKNERILTAEMTSAQRKLYEAEKKQARDIMKAGGRAFDVLPWLMRLRQICVDPATYVEGYTGGSGKMDLLTETVEQYIGSGHRILVFSQFVKALEIAGQRLADVGIGCSMITGDTPSDKRIRIAEDFNAGSGEPVILISLKAGGTGLNLVGADTVIHLDPWWNVAAENQASDRAYRIGQTRNVEVIKLICERTVEQKVIDLQESKKKVVETFISNDESSVTGARAEDISFILD